MIQEKINDRILALYQEKQAAGELRTNEQLESYYRMFRQKFGPEVLGGLDGEVLLNLMHDFGTHESLVYWLEFKNDDEFPAIFGSIAGGTALKYGVFRRKETDTWVTGSSQKQIEVTVEEAIQIARRHRDQLIRGTSIIDSMPDSVEDDVYRKLQEDLSREAPDVQNTAWGHKYFHLICPTKIDDYHVANFQRFHLIKMLQLPPEGEGRYICTGRYAAQARELNLSINSLSTILNQLHGRPYSYWRISTSSENGRDSLFSYMQNESVVAIGWEKLGDLSWLEYKQESKTKLKALLKDQYRSIDDAASIRGTANVFNFTTAINEGDLVLTVDGDQIFAVGRVAGGYQYKPNTPTPHQRPVNWLSFSKWQLPVVEGKNNPVYLIRKWQNMIAAEENILGIDPIVIPIPSDRLINRTPPRLDGISGRIQNVLDRKRQIILYGPPGTGKTFWAMRTANDLASYTLFGKSYSDLSATEKDTVLGINGQASGLVRRCTFHPAYGYEDFIEGYRPVSTKGQLAFEKRSGIFKSLCEDAQVNSTQPHYLIIDEINRGDIPRIFGELLTLLEKDKRGQSILLPLSGSLFHVPDNVYIIGTMNTADRSIALLDTALRRRFGFIELMPDSRLLDIAIEGLPLGPWLDALNDRILTHIGRDARNLQIGHAFFLDGDKPISDKAQFVRILREDILPLLEEYCYEDYDTLSNILGSRLIDLKVQRFNENILSLERWEQLLEALLAMDPGLMTSSKVLKTQQNETDEQLLVEPGEEVADDGDAG